MSGHSKWSTIKRKKGAADAKRESLDEPIREVWIHDQRVLTTRRSMRRIIARRTNAAALRA